MPATLATHSMEELTLPQLLRLAFKSVALECLGASGGARVWLDEQPATFHKKLRELQESLGSRLPTLGTIHFLDRGPFPYSRDVAVALEVLQQSGAINRENPNYTRFSPRLFTDTASNVEAEVERLFPDGTTERQAFREMVEALKELATAE